MKVLTTFHQPSSVLASVKCQLSTRDQEHLVVAKLNRLDVYSLQPEGLRHRTGIEVWGKVLTVKAVPIPGSTRSNVLLMTAHPDPQLIFLTYREKEDGSSELKEKKQLSLYERIPRPAEFFNDVLVHPSGKLAIASCYIGKLKVITLKAGSYDSDFDVSVPELNILSLAFLPLPEDQYSLAILHLDYQQRVQLLARDVIVSEYELTQTPSTLLQPTTISNKLIPLPGETLSRLVPIPYGDYDEDTADDISFLGGILVVGGKKILLYELSSEQSQEKQMGKRRRLENRKQSDKAEDVLKAKQKEKERENRKRKANAAVDWPWGEVTAMCSIDANASRLFIGDAFGKLAMLVVDDPRQRGLVLLPLGETSAPTTLSYLTNQVLFVGSHLGDSQLVQISGTPVSSQGLPTLEIPPEIKSTSLDALAQPRTNKGKGRALGDDEGNSAAKGTVVATKGSYVTVLDTFKNIAPIMDAVVVDTEGSGQKQIVTCSGGANTGSISVIRNGANFHELATIAGLTNVVNVWTLKDQVEDALDSFIVVSTLERTQVFQINDAGENTTLSYVQDTDIITNEPTLAISNVYRRVKVPNSQKTDYIDSPLVVQVTRQHVCLLEFDDGTGSHTQLYEWDLRGMEVVAADITHSQVILGYRGGHFQVLCVTVENKLDGVVDQNLKRGEISSVSGAPLNRAAHFTSFVTVSFWETNRIFYGQMKDGKLITVYESEPFPALIRSAIVYNFGTDATSKGNNHHPYMIVGLANGSVVYLAYKESQFKEFKTVSLGNAPVTLTTCEIDGKPSVLAVGNRALALSWDKKRVNCSPVIFKEIQSACTINTKSLVSSFIFSTPTGLSIGSIRDLGKMHVRSIPLGLDSPRKIVYQPDLKVFGVATTHIRPARIGDFEETKSSFKLFDQTTFALLGQYNCEANEQIAALVTYTPEIHGSKTPVFCLGIFSYVANETEPTNSRIVLLTATSHGVTSKTSAMQLTLVASVEVAGCIYDMTIVDDLIVAAISSSVTLYRLSAADDMEETPAKLERLSDWNHNYMVTSLSAYDRHIVAGDQISSVSLLRIDDTNKIESVARDYGPLWPVAVGATSEESLIGANDALNLFTFTLTRNLGNISLYRDGHYHMADFVTKFIRGSLTTSEASRRAEEPFDPQHVYFTSSGRIGVVADVRGEALALHLTELQRNLASAEVYKAVGLSHPRFRAPVNSRGRSDADNAATGFLDGDFLEQFLSYIGSNDIVAKVMEGTSEPEHLTMPIEDIQQVLEGLQSLH